MEKLLKVDDVAQALQVCRRTAYTYMGQMDHLERPRRGTEYSLRGWLAARTAGAGEKAAHGKGGRKSPVWCPGMGNTGEWKIPRRKGGGQDA